MEHGRGPVVHLGNVCQVPERFPRSGCAPWRGTALRVLSSILGTIPWHTGCTRKVPYGAVSGIPNLIFGGVIGDTEDFEVLFGLDDLVVRVGRIGVYHRVQTIVLCPIDGILHGQFQGIGCTLFGIVQGSQQLTQNLPKLTQFYQNLHEIIVSFMLTISIKFCTLL